MKTMSKWMMVGALLLSGLTVLAQAPPPEGGGERGGERGGRRGGGPGGGGGRGGGGRGGMMRGGGLMQYDADGNLQIDEKELTEGLAKLQGRLEKLKPFLLAEYDANKDGKLDKEESGAARSFFMSLMMLPRTDKDGDWELSNEEVATSLESLSQMSERYNEMMLKRADTDEDGKLSEEEIAAAKKEMAERRARGGRQGGGRQGGGRPGEGRRGEGRRGEGRNGEGEKRDR